MDETSADTTAKPLAVIVLVGLMFVFLAAMYFSAHAQNATELTPKHPDVVQYCICIGLVAALACAALMVLQTSGNALFRKVLVIAAAVLGFAAALQVSTAVTNVEQMRADFPVDKTQTYTAQWPVVDAYRLKTRKEGTSYSIHTPTLSLPQDIRAEDFNFMRANVAPEDVSQDGNQILSRGRFCANVVLQRAGDAVRLMVGPGRPLPAGSIGLCAQSAGN